MTATIVTSLPIKFVGAGLAFNAYMNFNPNDANLEFDIDKNLQKRHPESFMIRMPLNWKFLFVCVETTNAQELETYFLCIC